MSEADPGPDPDVNPPTLESNPDAPRDERDPDGRSPGEETPHEADDENMRGQAPTG